MVDEIDKTIAETDGVAPEADAEEEYRPIFKKYSDAAIPVSKSFGTLWRSRRDQAHSQLKSNGTLDVWDECIRYYKNDQSGKKNREDADNTENMGDSNRGNRTSGTENIIFANVSSLVPSIYAKNPDVTVVSTQRNNDETEKQNLVFQRLLKVLMSKRTSPGVNLKPKMRRAVVMSTLTNISYIEIGYTKKENSSEDTLRTLQDLSKKLESAKKDEIADIEGQLLALEDKIDLLSPSGPWTKFRHPKDVLVDPHASLGDLTDAKWVLIRDVVDTAFIDAVYREKNEEGENASIYRPTHVLKAGDESGRDISGHDIEINAFSLLDSEKTKYSDFGYEDEASFIKAQKTAVWYAWDKTTRRVYLYNDADWTWPIWVWDDPYGLEEFFPIIPVSFHTDPEDQYARGEAAYYLDQQDEINKINNAVIQFRDKALNKVLFNKRIADEKLLDAAMAPNNNSRFIAVDFDPALDLSKAFMSFPIPQGVESFLNKQDIYQQIDRLSSVSALQRGVEFKTNTTNKAIDSYESSTQTRLDEKIDAIEEAIGRIGAGLLTMCLQFMSAEEVSDLIGQSEIEWQQMSASEAHKAFELTITGGSSLKPTSKVRKEQAMMMGQTLGQFASKVPAAFVIALKVFQRAYGDEIDITSEDWDYIKSTIEQEMQRGATNPQPGGGAEGAPPPAQGGQPPQEGGGAQQVIMALSQALEQAPDEVKQQVGQAIASGVPLAQIVEQLAGQQQQPQQ